MSASMHKERRREVRMEKKKCILGNDFEFAND